MKASKPYSGLTFKVLTIILTGLLSNNLATAQKWYNAGWLYRLPVTITNAGSALTDFQVQVSLDAAFPWSHANSDGSDIRFTSSDGETELSYWIESWTTGTSATIWVKVPLVAPTPEITTIYLYYGNSLVTSTTSGDNTFEFFDDFETTSIITSGYYTLSSPGATILVQDQAWENSAPHTLDVVDWGSEKDGYRYWGYYGLQAYPQGDGIGLARSNDLATWTKYELNPLIDVTNARWPSVLLVGTTLHIFYTDYTGGNSTIIRDQSTDGYSFTGSPTLVVPSESGIYNGSPDLFIDPTNGTYYLYWVRIIGSTHEIMARSASTIEGLASSENITVMTSATTLAAPDMMYRDGNYFLTCEVFPSVWETYAWVSTSPVSGFTPVPGNPIVGNGSACYSQHIFGNTMHAYYAKLTGSIWTMEYRYADLTQGLSQVEIPDITKWTASGGTWEIATATQQNGSSGNVVHGITTAFQILRSSFSGSDYILEAYGYQVLGNEWGLGFRVENNQNYFTTNLYQNLDDLYLYNWISGSATAVTNVDAGTIDLNTWYKMTVKVHGNNFDAFVDDIIGINNAYNNSHPSGSVALFGEGPQSGGATNAYFDDVRVRKYATIEPGIDVSTAEEILFRWTGGLSTDWGTEGNWSSGVTPTSAEDITIPNVTNDPTISGTANCNNLIIEPSASLIIQAGGALTVNGDLINNGMLTIGSTLSSSGSLIVNGASTGNITYNRQLKPGSDATRDWHLVSAPVQNNTETNATKISAVYQWSELTGAWTTTSITSPVPGHGYNLRQTAGSDGLISFTGSLVNGDILFAASSPYADAIGPGGNYFTRAYITGRSLENPGGGGWNLLGNPYSSSILGSGFIDANYSTTPSLSQFDPNYVALYLFDGSGPRYYYIAKSTGWPGGGELSATHVQAGQGFFVLAMNDNSEFLFTRAMQKHSTGTDMLKSAGTADRWPGLQLKVKCGSDVSLTTIVYNEDMTTGLDPGYDVGLFNAGQEIELYTTLALKDNSVNFARQTLPVSGADTIIVPVGIDSQKGGEVNFSADVEALGNYKFWLEDRTTGTFTDLNTNTYIVTLPAKTYGAGRFFIIASTNTPTGIRQPEAEDADLRIWTSNNKIIIKGEVSDMAICEIYDLRGLKILEKKLADIELNTVTLPSVLHGVYLVRVIDGVKVTTWKVAIP